MTDADRADLIRRLTVLAEIMAEPMSATRLLGYTALLQEYPLVDLAPALEACAKKCRFFPRPIDITDAVVGVRFIREQAETQRLIDAMPEPMRETISEAQWQERSATLKAISARVKMKPHTPFRGRCDCNDCKRERGAHVTA